VLPWYQFQAGEWHAGRFPLWDPYQWGQSLIGQAQPGAAYPPNWLLFLVPLRHGWIRQPALNWYYVLTHYMAALFCFWLCRDLGRSRRASLLAGLGFSLAGWFGATDWPQMINGAVWAPLVVLFLLRALRGERPLASGALSGAFLGLAFLSGHHQVPIFMTLSCGALWLYGLFRGGRLNRALIAPAAAFGLFLFMVSALQTLPAYEYGRLAVRWVGGPHPVGWNEPVPYSVHAEFGLRPLSILGIVIPGFYRHADPYIGFVLAALAFLAVAAAWREWHVRVIAALALGGLVYSLAEHGVFEGIIYALVPVVEKARNPSMAIFIFHFGIAVLSAYGLDFYLSEERWSKRLWTALACLGALIFLLLCGTSLAVANPAKDFDMIALSAFSALLLAAALFAWKRGHISANAATTALVLLLLMEAGGAGHTFYWRHRDDVNLLSKKLSEHSDIAEFLRTRNAPVRVEMSEEAIPYNFGDWYGIDVFDGYVASLPLSIYRIQGDYRTRMLMGVNYTVSAKPTRDKQREVFTSRSGLKVYANVEAFPRTWSVHETAAVRSEDEIPGRLAADPSPLLRRRAPLAGRAPALETCAAPDRVRVLERTSSTMVIEAAMGCRGMVVAAEPSFPGWQATVDGRPAQLYEPYGLLRGVVADAGTHRIIMRYRPKTVLWGGILTGLGLLGTVIAVLGFRSAV
jgi:hypothetical protein